jgi:hypothetical protein
MSVSKIHECKQQLIAWHVGPVCSKLHEITMEDFELCGTSSHPKKKFKPQKVSKQMQHLRELLLKLTCTLQLSFVCEVHCKIGCRSLTKQSIPRCSQNIIKLLPSPPLIVVHHLIYLHELQNTVQFVQLLQDDHLFLPVVNPLRGRVVSRMHL